MKTILIILTFVLYFFQVKGQIVYIPDPAFKSSLLSNSSINTNGNSEIETTEASQYG